MKLAPYLSWRNRRGRVLDMLAAFVLLVLLSPILVLVALLVKLTSRGPVLYSADRLGMDGRVFHMHKFRSMHVNAPAVVTADGKVVVRKRDPRFTPIAPLLRVGLDELPQLLNVLRGEMLFIGPRPDTTDMLEHYTDEQRPRLLAMPGMTGLTQVLDGRHLTNDQNYALDVYYVEHASLWMDCMVLAYTIPFVLGRRSVGIPYLRRIMPEAAEWWERHHTDEEA